jgi:8-oxo-dGTP pyrophosphatase MutT (NUDIX family)
LNPDSPHPVVPTSQLLRQRLAGPRRLERIEEDAVPEGLTPAAVLVPIVERPEGLTVLLTQRTAHLNDHAGQVSFPGGRCEADDPSPVHTALRETEEEIGLDRRRIEVLGLLPEYRTGTGFSVVPVVGLVQPPLELNPDSFEVAEVFETPLAFLLDPANRQRHSMEIGGVLRQYYAMPYRGYFIWGATAGMLVSLHRLLCDE